jgi:hypothetical protein
MSSKRMAHAREKNITTRDVARGRGTQGGAGMVRVTTRLAAKMKVETPRRAALSTWFGWRTICSRVAVGVNNLLWFIVSKLYTRTEYTHVLKAKDMGEYKDLLFSLTNCATCLTKHTLLASPKPASFSQSCSALTRGLCLRLYFHRKICCTNSMRESIS